MDYQKISRREALKMYLEGQSFLLAPSKISPRSFMAITCEGVTDRTKEDFTRMENSFRYYNCNPEAGMAVRYWKVA